MTYWPIENLSFFTDLVVRCFLTPTGDSHIKPTAVHPLSFPSVSVSSTFFSSVFPQLFQLFLCCLELAARESGISSSFCFTYTSADIWGMNLPVVTPAATFLGMLSLGWGRKWSCVWLWGEKCVEDSCLPQTSSSVLFFPPTLSSLSRASLH